MDLTAFSFSAPPIALIESLMSFLASDELFWEGTF
jgi:hypothetical protein